MSGSPSLAYHSKHSNVYERTAGNLTRQVAAVMLSSISPPITSTSHILDNACGPAIVTSLIKPDCPSVPIVCADLTDGMLEETRVKVAAHGWIDVTTEKQDLMNLDRLKDGTFSHVITNFGIQALVFPEPESKNAEKAAREMYRVLKPGGVCAISLWSHRAFIPIFKRIYPQVKPGVKPPKIELPDRWRKGSWIVGVLEDAGFGDRVEVRCVDAYVEARNVREMAENLCHSKGWTFPDYSEEEMEQVKDLLVVELENSNNLVRGEGEVKLRMRAWTAFAWK